MEGNGSCSAAFCESAALRLVSSPSPSLLRKSTSPKGRGLGKEMKFAWTAKGSHFEERLPPAGGRCHRW